jgi:hypothetical protein
MPILTLPPEMMLGQLPKTKKVQLSKGERANFETLEMMKRVARNRSRHPLVRELALNILLAHKIKPNHYKDEAMAIARYVKAKVRYVRDIHGVETLYDPLTLIDKIKRGVAQADCDDYSTLIATLLLSIGHQPFFKIVKYEHGSGPWNHVYVVVFEKNPGEKRKPIVLDGILRTRKIGSEVKHLNSKMVRV